MTSKEAFECIVVDLTPTAKIHNKEEIEQVEKSLEVLEILKKYSYLVKRYRYSIDKDTIRTSLYCMNLDELEKVKEWLENDN